MIFRVSIFSRISISTLIGIAVLWTAVTNVSARGGSKAWIILKDCRLIPNPANDGDSFHVSVGPNEYLFRLYFVDAPETDEMTPRRLVDQAKYFAITVPQAIEVGRAAKEFTRQKLSTPFTVFTHMSDAMGQSRLERFYAFVETSEGDLGEQLVRNGLARSYGFKAIPPGLRNSQQELAKLQQLEEQAKQERIGGWGINTGRLNLLPQTASGFSSFVAEQETRSRPAPANSSVVVSSIAQPLASTAATNPVETSKTHGKKSAPLGEIEINTATEKELTTVPGIGHVMAARIIAARPFRSADDLKRVSGIGDKKYAQIRPYFQ
ncbi:MAG TPA: helix-hairpin-helix domain-containing protein [Candidatus Udaeobacter sp.]|nr:helix-hairpin-helix domain-containing protein [Candidatus Udaeobacter sp.]